jgi:hypothetical protein
MKIIDDFKVKWYSKLSTVLSAEFLQETVEAFRKFDTNYSNEIKNLVIMT